MTKEFVWLNGKIVPAEKALVPVFDRGLNYGDGVFETIKAVDGKPLFLKEHMKRLIQGARALRMDVRGLEPFIDSVNSGTLETLLKKNRLDRGDAYIKLLVTRGSDRGGHLPQKGICPAALIITKKTDAARLSVLREKGVGAITIEGMTPAVPGVKSLNYLASVLAKMSADKAGAFEALFTAGGLIIEGSSTNVFAVKKRRVTTPPPALFSQAGALPGIIRGQIKKLAPKNSIPFLEAPLTVAALEDADEAFLTNSIIGVIPLIKVNRTKIGSGRPGPLTRLFQRLLAPSGELLPGDSAP